MLFGGCFMIGVLLLVVGLPGPDTQPHGWGLWHDLLAILLLVMGVMCFLGGALLIYLGTIRIIRRPEAYLTATGVRGDE